MRTAMTASMCMCVCVCVMAQVPHCGMPVLDYMMLTLMAALMKSPDPN